MTDNDPLAVLPETDAPPKEKWARGPLFIAVAIPVLFALLGLTFLGYAIFRDQPPKAAPVEAVAAQPVTPAEDPKDARIARLEAELKTLRESATPPNTYTPRFYDDTGSLERIHARIDQLEANQRLMIQAAAAASAASGLQQASRGSQPFLSELADVEKSLTDTRVIAPLRPLAQQGVPSEVALAVEFPSWASRAKAAANISEDDGFFARIGNLLNGLLTVRRIDPASAKSTDAVLIHAQTRLDQGDLPGAIAHLQSLPPAARTALSGWLERAEQRVLVDQTVRNVSVEALSRLSQVNYSTARNSPAPAPEDSL